MTTRPKPELPPWSEPIIPSWVVDPVPKAMMHIPSEIKSLILRNVDVEDYLACMLTSKDWQAMMVWLAGTDNGLPTTTPLSTLMVKKYGEPTSSVRS